MNLEQKLQKLRERYKTAGELERKTILLAVTQLKKEYGVQNSKTLFEDTFKTAREVFGK
jgi:hypothetical protein